MQLQEIGILASGLATTEVTYVDCSHVGYWARLGDVTSGQTGREEDMMNEIRENLTVSARRTPTGAQGAADSGHGEQSASSMRVHGHEPVAAAVSAPRFVGNGRLSC